MNRNTDVPEVFDTHKNDMYKTIPCTPHRYTNYSMLLSTKLYILILNHIKMHHTAWKPKDNIV